jgi:hypothetical protein
MMGLLTGLDKEAEKKPSRISAEKLIGATSGIRSFSGSKLLTIYVNTNLCTHTTMLINQRVVPGENFLHET